MNRRIAATAAVLVIASAWPALAQARDLPSGGLTRDDVASWLRGKGYSVNAHNDTAGEAILSSSSAGGVNWDIYFFDCAGERCQSIQYVAGWSGLVLSLDKLNDWNHRHRFIRAYKSDHEWIWGEYDLQVSAGGTWEQLDTSLDRWNSSVANFKTYVTSP